MNHLELDLGPTALVRRERDQWVNDAVVIVAIAHERRPGYWKLRLRRTGS